MQFRPIIPFRHMLVDWAEENGEEGAIVRECGEAEVQSTSTAPSPLLCGAVDDNTSGAKSSMYGTDNLGGSKSFHEQRIHRVGWRFAGGLLFGGTLTCRCTDSFVDIPRARTLFCHLLSKQ